jgi:dihydrofolate reductase
MRNIIVSIFLTLDGCFEGPNKELDWHVWDDEMEEYMSDFLNKVDAILLGRVAYQLLADYWPTAIPKLTMPRNSGEEHPFIIERMNSLPKIVLSKTLDKVEWKNSTLIKENIKEEILKLKQRPGKDLVLFGGANIAFSLQQLGLIDEYRIILNPVILSGGNLFFKGIRDRLSLKLLNLRTFSCGNVLLYYRPIRE